jgi:hypothetical protein
MKRLNGAVLASIIALVGLANPVGAATPTPASGITWSQNQRVGYHWKSGDEPPAWAKAAMLL